MLLPSPTVANLEIRRSTAVLRRRRAARAARAAAVPQQGTAATTRHREDEVPGGDFARGFLGNQTVSLNFFKISHEKRKLIFPNDLCSEQILAFQEC